MHNHDVFFVTGLPGTGKSTLYYHFMENPVRGFSFFDFDCGKYTPPAWQEVEGQYHDWLIKQNMWWLEVARQAILKNKCSPVIFGFCLYPSVMLEYCKNTFFKPDDLHFAVLKCDDDVRNKGLQARGEAHLINKNTSWHAEFYKQHNQINSVELNTGDKDVEESAQEIIAWLIEA